MSDADDLVLNLWTTSGRPYVDRVVPINEIRRARGEAVEDGIKVRAPRIFPQELFACLHCGTIFTRGGRLRRTTCNSMCARRLQDRTSLAKGGCT